MNRFDIVMAYYIYCSLHHTGQGSELYKRLCKIQRYFQPGALFSETRFFDPNEKEFDSAREVYRAICRRNRVPDPFSILIALDRDEGYAPGCYLICRVKNPEALPGRYDWDTQDEKNTVLVQTDYDFPGVARTFGWGGDDEDIVGAVEYLDGCVEEGKVVEDPGYFEEGGEFHGP